MDTTTLSVNWRDQQASLFLLKLMKTQPDVVILCNDAKSEEAGALIA